MPLIPVVKHRLANPALVEMYINPFFYYLLAPSSTTLTVCFPKNRGTHGHIMCVLSLSQKDSEFCGIKKAGTKLIKQCDWEKKRVYQELQTS
jgi:hypothetical protein